MKFLTFYEIQITQNMRTHGKILDDKVDEILDILRDSEELGISKHSYRKESNG